MRDKTAIVWLVSWKWLNCLYLVVPWLHRHEQCYPPLPVIGSTFNRPQHGSHYWLCWIDLCLTSLTKQLEGSRCLPSVWTRGGLFLLFTHLTNWLFWSAKMPSPFIDPKTREKEKTVRHVFCVIILIPMYSPLQAESNHARPHGIAVNWTSLVSREDYSTKNRMICSGVRITSDLISHARIGR